MVLLIVGAMSPDSSIAVERILDAGPHGADSANVCVDGDALVWRRMLDSVGQCGIVGKHSSKGPAVVHRMGTTVPP